MPGLNYSHFKFRRKIQVNPRGSPKMPPWLAGSNVPIHCSIQRKALPIWYCNEQPGERYLVKPGPMSIYILRAARAYQTCDKLLYQPVGSNHSPSPFFLQQSGPQGTYNSESCMPTDFDGPIPPESMPRNVF